jgi:phosphohistidine phosphatase SixA
MNRRHLAAVALSVLLSACAPTSTPDITTEIYLVRHAEKTKAADDPALTDAGQARALALRERLITEDITRIFSTDTRRTRDTAAPLAEAMGLEVEIYDAGDLAGFAQTLKATPGTHLVVGHSNTTPQLVEWLGGEGGEPIVEATEYDRLYVVRQGEDGLFTSVLERFGARAR